ncbi:hypothetical protein [Turneriella parva]|uniref:Uncharacterized protein n=1 Tax=Turneriella parva (strain ATCC BAA-1111 / DSM 21527 / NCTC 11395 / H) TaxID=869212 RepID=I4B832_TURPD|nr:hypothetical protein [Turneriella parva]AFM13439.1 hypothetical protein Turpa_2800 [Turneriella parva DSM 21527]
MEERILDALRHIVGENNRSGYRVMYKMLQDHVVGQDKAELTEFSTVLHQLASADVFDIDGLAYIVLRNPL